LETLEQLVASPTLFYLEQALLKTLKQKMVFSRIGVND